MDTPHLLKLYVSPGHNFFGRHGLAPGTHPADEPDAIRCVAGRGIEGDRFFAHEPGHKGQITFFAAEVYAELCGALGVRDRPPSVFRRNIVTRGLAECKPCHWMNGAFHPEAEAQLQGRGGLRAKILSDGMLALGPALLEIFPP